MVGFEQTSRTVGEGDGEVELCVAISSPEANIAVPFSFSLIVNTQIGTAGIL